MTRLTVVIVTYQSRHYIDRCLDSVRRATESLPAQVVVVDNASSDGTPGHVGARHRDVELIALEENVGFGRANNTARAIARGELVCFLNPDVKVYDGALIRLASYLEEHPTTGAAGPHLVREDGRTEPGCRRSFPTPSSALARFTGLDRLFPHSRRVASYNLLYVPDAAALPVDCISGAFLMARRDALDGVGWFDEDYFLYGEDIDLCYRLRQAGHLVAYVGSAQSLHTGGASVRFNPRRALDEFYRAMELFVEKHYRGRYSWPVRWAVRGGIRFLWGVRRVRFGLTAG